MEAGVCPFENIDASGFDFFSPRLLFQATVYNSNKVQAVRNNQVKQKGKQIPVWTKGPYLTPKHIIKFKSIFNIQTE